MEPSSQPSLPDAQIENTKSPGSMQALKPGSAAATNSASILKHLDFPVYGDDPGFGSCKALFHLPAELESGSIREEMYETGAILVAGIFGGYHGPSSIYEEIGERLASLTQGIPVLRVDFRRPGHSTSCIEDIWSAMAHMERLCGVSKFVLVGWSYGGAPVFATAAQEKERVVGCATIASQYDGTRGVRLLSPRPLLLLHGTGDQVCGASWSEALYSAYGAEGDRTLRLFNGDDHELSNSRAEAIDLLCDFIVRCATSHRDEKG